MSAPTRGRRPLDDDELLALAQAVPEPALTDERREEMRTAFLSRVRGLRSGAHVQLVARRRRRRLLFLGLIIAVGCAGAAAAAWRAHRPSHEPSRKVPVVAAALAHSPKESAPIVLAAAPEQRASLPPETTHNVIANHPRKVAVAPSRVRGHLDGDNAAEVAFARGWTSLRTGDFNTAAEWFARAATGQPSALGEDAMFWQGVALDRAGRFEAAQRVLSDFVTRYPDSDRKGEASVILGWLLVRSGESAAARAFFDGALDDPAERVRKSARSGLIATERHVRGAPIVIPQLP